MDTQAAPLKRQVYIVASDHAAAGEFAAVAAHAGFETAIFGSGRMFQQISRDLQSGVALIEMQADDATGLRIIEQFKRENGPHVPIGTSSDANVKLAVNAMRAGALHYIPRPCNADELVAALHEAHLKLLELASTAVRTSAAKDLVDCLTARQREILRGLVSGERNSAMSARLGLSRRTVETYRRNMMERLQATTVGDAVRIGLEGGIRPLAPEEERG